MMQTMRHLLHSLDRGAYDAALRPLYALDQREASLLRGRGRAKAVAEAFQQNFSPKEDTPAALFSGPGRTEIGGNHTDHQHGHVLCASVDLDMLACAAPNGTMTVRLISEGYAPAEIDLTDLEPKAAEEGTSAALVRGVAARIASAGYELSGVDIYAASTVISGSGLSSSAAFEILVGNIFNTFFCDGVLDPIFLAQAGQFAENRYFGKPCGLMDQMGASVGGAIAIDFEDPENPAVQRVGYDFTRSGHVLCILDTGSDHSDLTEDYAQITREMGAAAALLGGKVLRDIPESKFRERLDEVRRACGDRAVLRALHYYTDDRRAVWEAQALSAGDFSGFLALMNESGRSSELCLQNIWSPSNPKCQAVALTLALGRELLRGKGAIRVHGGGFAGTVQAFVPRDELNSFRNGMEAVLGEGKCHVLHIRPVGGCEILPRT